LHYSYALGQEELVKQLLEINAKLPKDKQITRIFDNDGYSPKDLLLEFNEAAVRKTLINLEMHPDRSIHAKRNNVFSGDDDSTLNTGENKFLLLSNKLFLEEFVGCHDYFSVSSDAKNIIGSFLNKCNKMPENSRGKTIGQECWKNVQSLQRDQEQPPKFQTTIQSNKGKNWQSTVTRSFHSSASKVPTLGVIRNSNKSLGLLS
jgi:hypothetical protein